MKHEKLISDPHEKHMIKYYKKWNTWRKRCINNWFYKFLVLIGFIHGPSFEAEIERIMVTAREQAALKEWGVRK